MLYDNWVSALLGWAVIYMILLYAFGKLNLPRINWPWRKKIYRLELTISQAGYDRLQYLAEQDKISIIQVFRRALVLLDWIVTMIKSRGKLVIIDPEGNRREVDIKNELGIEIK